MGYQLWTPGKITPFFTLYVGGYEIGKGLKDYVESITVSHCYQEVLKVKISIRDDKLQWIDLNVFDKGVEWLLMLGPLGGPDVFGPLTVGGYGMNFTKEGFCQIELELQDKGGTLKTEAKARSWAGKNIGQVVQQIAEENGMGFIIEDSDKHAFSHDAPGMQADWTDATFLRKMADRYGYYFAIQNGNIVFRQDQVNKDLRGEPMVLSWRVGSKSLMSFKPAQTQFYKKGGGHGHTGQSGADSKGPNVGILAGAIFGTKDGEETSMEKALKLLAGGEEELREGGPVGPSTDTKGGDTSAVTEPGTSGSSFAQGALSIVTAFAAGGTKNAAKQAVKQAGESFWPKVSEHSGLVKRKAKVPLRDAGETPGDKGSAATAAAAAGAGTKSDLALASAELTVYDTTVRQGDPVEVIGVGRRFSGRWRIIEFEHKLTKEGLFTELRCTKKGLGPSSKTAAAVDSAWNEFLGTQGKGKDPFIRGDVSDNSGFTYSGSGVSSQIQVPPVKSRK